MLRLVDIQGGNESGARVATLGPGGSAIEAERLNRWSVDAHLYRGEAAVEAGLFGRLFGVKSNAVQAGVVHQAARYVMLDEGEATERSVGVAVRLNVAINQFDAELQVTLPNLAATAQLSAAEARVEICVLGYTGPLGSNLPAPSSFDVEAYATYLQAFERIQSLVFGDAGLEYAAPTLLAVRSESPRAQ